MKIQRTTLGNIRTIKDESIPIYINDDIHSYISITYGVVRNRSNIKTVPFFLYKITNKSYLLQKIAKKLQTDIKKTHINTSSTNSLKVEYIESISIEMSEEDKDNWTLKEEEIII